MTTKYLSLTGFAQSVGLSDSTIESYMRKGLLPEPDIYYIMRNGQRPAWTIDTIGHWLANRPGRGNRTWRNAKENNK